MKPSTEEVYRRIQALMGCTIGECTQCAKDAEEIERLTAREVLTSFAARLHPVVPTDLRPQDVEAYRDAEHPA